jgi:hypothetical protein
MLYIDPNGNFPRYYGDIASQNPGWALGDALPTGWQLVADAPSPEYAEDETFEDGEPALVDGVLTRTFVVRKLTTEELELRSAPLTARQRFMDLGFTDAEISAIARGII